MSKKSFLSVAALCCTSVAGSCYAQQSSSGQQSSPKPTPAPANYQGCVSKLPNVDQYVLATVNRCMLLAGNFKSQKILDHLVVLHGLLLEPSSMTPLTLKVDAIVEVKDLCSQTCKLVPPGDRGVPERPGSEGGPPGVVPPSPPH